MEVERRLDTTLRDMAATPVGTRHLARFFMMSPDLLAAAGFDGLLKLFNSAWEKQLGYSREHLATHPYLELVHPDDLAATEAEIAKLAQGEFVSEYVCRLVRVDGEIRWYAWSGGPGDEAFYIVGRDVSERRALEDDLRQFAYIASHDLSEPLRVVRSYVQLLERRHGEQLDPGAQELIRQAVDGTTRMKRLIDDLLRFSRVANVEAEHVPVDLQVVTAEALEGLSAAIDDTGATVHVEALPTVVAEPTQMLQLLQNLIGNAVKFRGERPPVVRVSARRTPEGWDVVVADDGRGIAEADRERIFSMFTRLVRDEEHEGTGIGLALCRKIAEGHGGRIWVDSEVGAGSAFHVLLPTED